MVETVDRVAVLAEARRIYDLLGLEGLDFEAILLELPGLVWTTPNRREPRPVETMELRSAIAHIAIEDVRDDEGGALYTGEEVGVEWRRAMTYIKQMPTVPEGGPRRITDGGA